MANLAYHENFFAIDTLECFAQPHLGQAIRTTVALRGIEEVYPAVERRAHNGLGLLVAPFLQRRYCIVRDINTIR